MSVSTEAEELRAVLADLVLSAVLHPAMPDHFEVVPSAQMAKVRMMIDDVDICAAAFRARAVTVLPPSGGAS